MPDRIGVFVCTGYGIASALDVEALCGLAREQEGVAHCATVDSCEQAGLAEIARQALEHELNKVVVAGTSGRRWPAFAFPPQVLVEKVPLREYVVRTQPPGEEDTQALAADYLRMAIAKIEKMTLPEPFVPEEALSKDLLVIGGGVAGLTAALEAARAGYRVHLVEKSGALGGWLARQHLAAPTHPPYRELEPTGIDELITEVCSHRLITCHLGAVTASISGAPGLFDVTIAAAGNGGGPGQQMAALRVGAIVQATGWQPAEPRQDLTHLSYPHLPDVIRNVDLEQMVKEHGRITRPSDGREVRSVAFIQCGGSRDRDHHSYCSAICCLTSLKQALYLRERVPDGKAYIFYEFLRTPGQYEDFYRRVQEDPGVFLTRAEVSEVKLTDNGVLRVIARNTMPGELIEVRVDLVVLATGMMPVSADGEAIRQLADARLRAEQGESEAQRREAAALVERLEPHAGSEILNLQYRQGPDLPVLEHAFPDSHFICFPYESRRTGIYPAGAVRRPGDAPSSRTDGTGAALKAIQCVEMLARGEAVHPRAGDRTHPTFFLQRCTQCKRCTEECPFGVLNEDEKGTPQLWTTRCRRCGVCMGACPERIVSFQDFSVDIVNAMIKAVEVPEEDEEKPRILALMCENDAYPALDLAGEHGLRINPYVRAIPVRCLGSVNTEWVRTAISAGYDGVLLIGCKYGDDYQCHFIKGSELAESRGENIREKLEQMAMEEERVEIHQLQIDEYKRLQEIFSRFGEVIEEIGMNPFKGM
jgi:quinone-modifying oxidoreductase subunit QmoB